MSAGLSGKGARLHFCASQAERESRELRSRPCERRARDARTGVAARRGRRSPSIHHDRSWARRHESTSRLTPPLVSNANRTQCYRLHADAFYRRPVRLRRTGNRRSVVVRRSLGAERISQTQWLRSVDLAQCRSRQDCAIQDQQTRRVVVLAFRCSGSVTCDGRGRKAGVTRRFRQNGGSRPMKIVVAILVVLGLLGMALGVWGLFTDAGRARFDEMDGLIPFFCGVAGAILIIAAAVIPAFRFLLRARKRRSA